MYEYPQGESSWRLIFLINILHIIQPNSVLLSSNFWRIKKMFAVLFFTFGFVLLENANVYQNCVRRWLNLWCYSSRKLKKCFNSAFTTSMSCFSELCVSLLLMLVLFIHVHKNLVFLFKNKIGENLQIVIQKTNWKMNTIHLHPKRASMFAPYIHPIS